MDRRKSSADALTDELGALAGAIRGRVTPSVGVVLGSDAGMTDITAQIESALKPNTPPQTPLIEPLPAVQRYRGRFAPSPTGPLHAGSLVAALASWLDARAHDGAWLVRMEDIDPPREVPGAAQDILATLADFGMTSDEPVLWQSSRSAVYADALARLQSTGRVYGCSCTRSEIAAAALMLRLAPAVYPGTCRAGARGPVRAQRLNVDDAVIGFDDRWHGQVVQHLAQEVGDFVVRRADGLWAYQLAVVVDDAAQGITDVVRGADLLDNTPRQILLQRALALPTPRYLHVPVVLSDAGEKLSKQTGARPLDRSAPLVELERAWQQLGFARLGADDLAAFQRQAVAAWRARWVPRIAVSP
jgi:glutamyl-Q tRNA(Asp) synthetase